MSLAHAILGLLQQQERTGYDLKTTCFDDCIAHVWQADQAQIYRTLDKLGEQGWITCSVEIQRDRPNRKVYSITPTGKAELCRWLQTHQPLPITREPLLVQLHFGAQLPNDAILDLLKAELAARQEKLATCEAIHRDQAPSAPNPLSAREQSLQQLVLDLITRREKTYIEWLMDAIAHLSNIPEP